MALVAIERVRIELSFFQPDEGYIADTLLIDEFFTTGRK